MSSISLDSSVPDSGINVADEQRQVQVSTPVISSENYNGNRDGGIKERQERGKVGDGMILEGGEYKEEYRRGEIVGRRVGDGGRWKEAHRRKNTDGEID